MGVGGRRNPVRTWELKEEVCEFGNGTGRAAAEVRSDRGLPNPGRHFNRNRPGKRRKNGGKIGRRCFVKTRILLSAGAGANGVD